MNKIVKKFIATVLLFVPLYGFGQKKMESGFIVKNNGEQVVGLIDLQSNALNSKTCIFQDPKAGTLESFTPDDIKAYKTSDKYYTVKEVEIDSVKKKLFLEFLVDGIVDLYYLKDGTSEYYFVEKEDQLYPLQNNEVQVYIEGNGVNATSKMYSKNSNQYKGALNYLFSDGKDMASKVATTPFNYRSLIQVTKDYHNAVCNEYECIDFTRSAAQRIKLEISVGADYSQMRLKTSDDFDENFRPVITGQLRFEPMKSNSSWIFLIGLSYSYNNYKGTYVNHVYSYTNPYIHVISERYSNIKIPLNIQYEFGSGKIKPILSAGYSACYYATLSYEGLQGNQEEYGRVKKYNHGFTAGIGMNYQLNGQNYVFIKANYEYRIPSANMHHIYDYVRNKSVSVNFGYAFSMAKK